MDLLKLIQELSHPEGDRTVDEGKLGAAESQGSQVSIPQHSQTIEEMMHSVSGRPDVRGLSSRVKSRTGFGTGVRSIRCFCVLSHRYKLCRVSLYRDTPSSLCRSLLTPCFFLSSLPLPPCAPPCSLPLTPYSSLSSSLVPPCLLLTRYLSIPIVMVFHVRPQGPSACMDHVQFKSEDILRLESRRKTCSIMLLSFGVALLSQEPRI